MVIVWDLSAGGFRTQGLRGCYLFQRQLSPVTLALPVKRWKPPLSRSFSRHGPAVMGDELHPGASISDGAKNTTDPDTGRTPTGAPLAELGDAQGGALRGMRPANPPVYTVAEPPERLATAGALPHPSSPVYPSHAATPAGAAAYQPAVPAHGPPSHLTPEQPVAGVNYPAFSASHAVPHWVPGSSATPGTQPSPATYGTLYGAAAPLHAGVTMPFAPSADFATPVELGSALGSQQPALLQLARAGYQGFSFPVAGPRQTPAPVPSRPSAAAVTGPSQGRPVSAATQEPGRRVAQVRAHTGPAPRMVGRPPAEHADGGRGRGRRRPQERNPYG